MSAKISAPSTAGQIRQRPKMTSAMQTQPRPPTMSSVKLPSSARVRNAPPSAISAPPTISAGVAGAGHRDAGGVGGLGVLADGAQRAGRSRSAAAPTRRPARPPGRRRTSARTGRGCADRRSRAGHDCIGSIVLQRPPPANSSRLRELADGRPAASVMPMPATCWFAPQRHGQQPHQRPGQRARRRRRRAGRAAASRCAKAAGKPTNAPAYIVPSMPRLSTPVRSTSVSPTRAEHQRRGDAQRGAPAGRSGSHPVPPPPRRRRRRSRASRRRVGRADCGAPPAARRSSAAAAP